MQTSTPFEPDSSANNGAGESQASTRTNEIRQKAASAIEDRMDAVARGIDAAASAIRGNADRLPGGERVAGAAHTAADAMESAADYMRDHDVESMLSDARQFPTKHPGATLLTAAAVGFLLARAFARK